MERLSRASGTLIAALLIVGLALPIELTSARTVAVLEEDFEGQNPLLGWSADDEEAGGGLDFWGATAARAATGAQSVWCAQNGTNSATNQSNAALRRYDAQMDANLARGIGALSGYRSARLQFAVWAETDPLDARERLSVWSWDGARWLLVWIQGVANSSGWQVAVAPLPLNTTAISFNFYSGAGLPVEEGVYVDEVLIEAETKPSGWWPFSPLVIVGIAGAVALAGTLVYLMRGRRPRPPIAPSP